jgi:arylformamidase
VIDGLDSWRAFDKPTLEREYSPSSCIDDIGVFIRMYVEQSAAARRALPAFYTLEYGKHPDETLDFFPALLPNAPLHVFIHGGYWQELSKDESSFAAPNLVAHGAAFAAINYTLAPQASVAQIVDQCRRALAFLWQKGAALGVDPERITISGSSAGGHLVAMMLNADWPSLGAPAGLVKGALAASGVFDLRPIAHTYINDPLHLDESSARLVSPIFDLPRAPVPLVLTVGQNETSEFKRQSGAYAAAWIARDYPLTFVPMPGFNHFDVILELNNPHSPLFAALADVMEI